MAQAVKAKYAKHYGPYLGMGYSFCAFGTGTHSGFNREPDACCLLCHLSYAWTTLVFQKQGLDGAGRAMMLLSTSVRVPGPFVTSL